MSQTILEDATVYFKNALTPGTFYAGEEGHLHFPQDHRDAWEVFLYWLFHKDIPVLTHNQRTLVRCWCLGDKYGIPSFQDHIMWFLLIHFRSNPVELDAVKEGFENTAPHSSLRQLLVEETAKFHASHTRQGELGLSGQDFEMLDGTGFIGEFMEIYTNWEEIDELDRFEPYEGEYEISEDLEAYMVGDGPVFPLTYESKYDNVRNVFS